MNTMCAMSVRVLTLSLGVSLSLAGCATMDNGINDVDSDSQESGVTTYVDVGTFNNSALQGAWYDINSQLAGEFNNVCGDTFCEGDYANLTPLTLMCAVSSKAGQVHDCSWTFAGSYSAVDATTAVIHESAPTYQCHFKANTTITKLVTLLQSSNDAIDLPLPGTNSSIYDSLFDCFQHGAIGAMPFGIPDVAAPKYVDGDTYYVSATSVAKWSNTKTALLAGFNNICGDTFCSSDYSDLQSLDFQCAITKSSGTVKSCNWVFGGSVYGISKTGTVTNTSKTFICPIAMKGTFAQFLTTMTGTQPAGSPEPINRPLPGMTTSVYDQINGCLP